VHERDLGGGRGPRRDAWRVTALPPSAAGGRGSRNQPFTAPAVSPET
jgi:hypothetical protein